MNEKFSPELLVSKTELVECMLDQITEMEDNIRRAKKGDFKVSLHSMEVSCFARSPDKGSEVRVGEGLESKSGIIFMPPTR